MVCLHTDTMGVHPACILFDGQGYSPPRPGIPPETTPPILHILPLIAHQLASAREDFATGAFKPVDDIVTEMKAEMDGRMRPVPIFIIQSEADQTVKFQYAENIRDSWGKAFGVDMQHPISSESGETKGTSWTHTKYGRGPDGNTVVETLIIHPRPDGGLKQGWYGGGDGQCAFSNAPNTAQLAWEFFKTHPLPRCPCPIQPPPK